MKPSVTSFTPTSGAVGSRVLITGAGFTGATAVSFGGAAATFNVESDTQITASVPACGTGPSAVIVTTPQGVSAGGPTFSPTPSPPVVQGRGGAVKQVYSTLSADTRYTGWEKTAGLNTPHKGVLIRGGAGIAVRGGAVRNVVTPQGVRTEVSAEDAAWLMQHPQFREHMKNGFIRVQDQVDDPNKAAQSMAVDKGSAPKSDSDVAADNARAGKDGKDEDGKPLQAVTNAKK
jgi:hypothetical protein